LLRAAEREHAVGGSALIAEHIDWAIEQFDLRGDKMKS
jgi:hypothetical protein